jgi:hypothetical protein
MLWSPWFNEPEKLKQVHNSRAIAMNEDQRILNEAREAAEPKSSGIGAIIGSVAFFGFLWYIVHSIYALDC